LDPNTVAQIPEFCAALPLVRQASTPGLRSTQQATPAGSQSIAKQKRGAACSSAPTTARPARPSCPCSRAPALRPHPRCTRPSSLLPALAQRPVLQGSRAAPAQGCTQVDQVQPGAVWGGQAAMQESAGTRAHPLPRTAVWCMSARHLPAAAGAWWRALSTRSRQGPALTRSAALLSAQRPRCPKRCRSVYACCL